MKNGAPYVEFAFEFRAFLKKKGYMSPAEFQRDLRVSMGKDAPSTSAVYMAFYGARRFNGVILAFMRERYEFAPSWRALLPVKNLDGTIKKANQIRLQGMLELRGLR